MNPIAEADKRGTIKSMQLAGNTQILKALLAGFGVNESSCQNKVTTTINSMLAGWKLRGKVTSIRWGKATIETDPVTAAKLKWWQDSLASAITLVSNGEVTSVRIKGSTDEQYKATT